MTHIIQKKLDLAYETIDLCIKQLKNVKLPERSTNDMERLEYELKNFLNTVDNIKAELASAISFVVRKYDEWLTIINDGSDLEEVCMMMEENSRTITEVIAVGTKQLIHTASLRKQAEMLHSHCAQNIEETWKRDNDRAVSLVESNPESGNGLSDLKTLEFNGDVKQWPQFWSVFSELVDSKEMPDSKKLFFLNDCLCGEPKSHICGIDDYSTAIGILQKLYDHKDVVKILLYKELCAIPSACDESMLPQMWAKVDAILQQFVMLGVTVNTPEIIQVIESKLPAATLRKIDDIKRHNNTWTLGILKMFIRSIVGEQLANNSLTSTNNEPFDMNKVQDNKQKGNCDLPKQSSNNMQVSSFKTARGLEFRSCVFCGGGHFHDACKRYSTIWSRIERAEALKLCKRCLRRGHDTTKCRTLIKRCFHCKNDHVSAMCSMRFGDSNLQQLLGVPFKPNSLEIEDFQYTSFPSPCSSGSNKYDYSDSGDNAEVYDRIFASAVSRGRQRTAVFASSNDILYTSQQVVEFPDVRKEWLNSLCSNFEPRYSNDRTSCKNYPVAEDQLHMTWEIE